jgi:hypothetical protein
MIGHNRTRALHLSSSSLQVLKFHPLSEEPFFSPPAMTQVQAFFKYLVRRRRFRPIYCSDDDSEEVARAAISVFFEKQARVHKSRAVSHEECKFRALSSHDPGHS